MIYSRWRPTGGYDYFQTSGVMLAGDDLPVPRFPGNSGNIGVASIDAGRSIPSEARHVGSGPLPRGVVAGADLSMLSGAEGATMSVLGVVLCAAAVAGAVYLMRRQHGR
jgi:hypothetical protein